MHDPYWLALPRSHCLDVPSLQLCSVCRTVSPHHHLSSLQNALPTLFYSFPCAQGAEAEPEERVDERLTMQAPPTDGGNDDGDADDADSDGTRVDPCDFVLCIVVRSSVRVFVSACVRACLCL